MELNFEDIKAILPHRFPLLMIDRVTECVPGDYLRAIKVISGSDPVLQGHYPGYSIFPGVYLIETLAQAMSILAVQSHKELNVADLKSHIPLLTSVDKIRFRRPVHPGDVLQVHAKISRIKLRTIYCDGLITCGDKKVCDGRISCSAGLERPQGLT